VRVLLFDIDGTILVADGAGRAALEEALRAEMGVRGELVRVAFAGRTDRAIVEDILAAHGLGLDEQSWARYLTAYLKLLPAQLTARNGRVLPGIVALLDLLGARDDAAVGLLTGNLRAAARIKLDHFGIADRFAFGGYGDEHRDRSLVARDALAEAQRHLGAEIRPSDVWVIGDTPHDVQCAHAVGARALAVATGFSTREELEASQPDVLLADLTDPAAIAILLG
jgi:phosphoglycolate phosphatase-like HAD superfamily hydrolase